MSAEAEQVIHRIDDLYDVEIGNEIGNETAQSPINRGSEALKSRMLARQQREKINESLLIAGAMPAEPLPEMDIETGELLDGTEMPDVA